MFGSRKINAAIDFPLQSLDLSPYLVQSQSKINFVDLAEAKNSTPESKSSNIYDLYAVSNHFGSMGGGHYTAFCKNPLYKDKWFCFDDSRVSEVEPRRVCSSAAYVLFY